MSLYKFGCLKLIWGFKRHKFTTDKRSILNGEAHVYSWNSFLSFLNLFEAKQNLFDAYKKVSAVFVIILFQCRKNCLTENLRDSQVLAIVTSKLLLKTSKFLLVLSFFSHNKNKEFAMPMLWCALRFAIICFLIKRIKENCREVLFLVKLKDSWQPITLLERRSSTFVL